MAKLDLLLFEFDLSNKQVLLVIAGLGIAGYLIYQQSKKAFISVANKVNPVSPENVFYETFTGAYKTITGSGQDLGADIYDLLHPKISTPVKEAQFGIDSQSYKTLSPETKELLEYLEIQGN